MDDAYQTEFPAFFYENAEGSFPLWPRFFFFFFFYNKKCTMIIYVPLGVCFLTLYGKVQNVPS
jgi:hypothetical protein